MPHPTDTIWQSCEQWASPQRELLYDTVINLKAQTVLEIGTNIGDSTRILSAALRETGGQLYSLDNEGVREAWPERWDCTNITFLRGDSTSYTWEKELDLLLVDGDHKYETALSDLNRFAPWVRQGGQVVVHDTVLFEPVRRALHEWSVLVQLTYTQHPQGVGLAIVPMEKSLPR